jgi:iron complex outermembrane receptor protein
MGAHPRARWRRPLPAALAALLLLGVAAAAAAAPRPEPTPARVATTDTVLVVGDRPAAGPGTVVVAPGQDMAAVLQASPFVMVTRGTPGVSDLYADGFRRNDLTLTVDGERFDTACPNRMDTRLGQIDLLDIDTVGLARDGAGLQSGLGGAVSLRRKQPGSAWRVEGRAEALAGHAESIDGSLAVEGRGLRLATRWRQLEAFTDADDRTFADLYGFASMPTSRIFEIRAQARLRQGDLRASQEHSTDLLFPYLLMDERENDHFEVSGSWRGHRLYLNRTDHLMDNGLRRSVGTTLMSTDALNTMFGAVGDRYELYARNWDAENFITPVANPMGATRSHMLPDVWRLGAALRGWLGDKESPWLTARLGLAHTEAHDGAQAAAFRRVHADAEMEKWSVPFGVTVSHRRPVRGAALSASAELAADAPGIEQQFIVVDKPGMMTDWVGNPGLADPLRGTLRVAMSAGPVKAEVFGTHVRDYPNLVSRTVSGVAYQTYDGVEALLAGASVRADWKLMDAGLSWNWGEQTATDAPLSEIQPVMFDLRLRTPQWRGGHVHATYTHAAGQGRIDPTQNEEPTDSWNRLDLGVVMELEDVRLALTLDNATNALYTQHLSYQRNPFASGLRVWEPGRTGRLSAAFAF